MVYRSSVSCIKKIKKINVMLSYYYSSQVIIVINSNVPNAIYK